ncbi:MAG: glycosyl transferase, partial [Treponema sp.]|nr:glycosyl transferase [Treponema sp.]
KFSEADIQRKKNGTLISSQDSDVTLVNKAKAEALIKKFSTVEAVDAAYNELRSMWDALLDKYVVKSDDEKLNRMVNIWSQYQCMITFNFSRSASFFESGVGRGMGFRDSNQDLVGFVHQVPSRARERIIDIASTQFPDGGCYHQYSPLTKKGNADIGGDFSDDPLWLILSVSAYIKESGDWSILDEMVPYDNDMSKAQTMLEHLKVSFYRIVNNLGPHGLPLAMRADWNDCINLSCFSDTPGESFQTYTNPKFKAEGGYSKVAESVFVAALFTFAGPNYVSILNHVGKKEEAAKAQAEIDKMKKVMMESAWDGNWFIRAYDANGEKMGSKDCEESKIFIEPQGFAIMSDIDKDATEKTLKAIDENLNCEFGLVLNYPAFTKYHVQYGEISTYPQGYKENGGIFTHNNAWIICAAAYAGKGDQAFKYYSEIAPSYTEETSDIHKTEPYVYGQMIGGKEAGSDIGNGGKNYGQGKNSWLTGTAAWNMVAISQYILGIKPDFDGLMINPSIPSSWDGFKATRLFRGAKYNITIKNPNHVCKGVKSLVVDGKAIDGCVVPFVEGKKEVNVEITLG